VGKWSLLKTVCLYHLLKRLWS